MAGCEAGQVPGFCCLLQCSRTSRFPSPRLALQPPAPRLYFPLQHDDGIVPDIVAAVNATVGNRKNPNGCSIPLTW